MKKYLLMLMVIICLIGLLGVTATAAQDYVFSTNSPSEAHTNVIFSLTNNTGEAITITGPVKVSVMEYEAIDTLGPGDLLFDGSLEIAAGETAAFAEIEPGAPITWRNFYSQRDITITVSLNIDGAAWQSSPVRHTITGDVGDDEEVHGGFSYAAFAGDNRNGTCTVTVWVRNGLNAKVTGLAKSDFGVNAMHPTLGQAPVGKIISVTETKPGKYRLIWSHDPGNHNIIITAQEMEIGVGRYMDNVELAVTVSSAVPSRLIEGADPDQPIDFLGGRLLMVVDSGESEYVLGAALYHEDEAKGKPADTLPAGFYLNLTRSENIDGDRIRVVLFYNPDDIPSNINISTLRIYRYIPATGQWEEVAEQGINVEANYIWMWLDRFSTFGVFGRSGAQPAAAQPSPAQPLPATGSAVAASLYCLLASALLGSGAVLTARRKHRRSGR